MASSLLNHDFTDPSSQSGIDWAKTEAQFGHNLSSTGNSTKSVSCICQKCGAHYTTRYHKFKRRSGPYCNKCIRQLAIVKASISIQHKLDGGQPQRAVSAGLRKKWRDDPDFRKRATKANKLNGSVKTPNKSHSEVIRALWENEEYRRSQTAAKSKPSYRLKISKAITAKWTDDQYRLSVSESSRLLWERDDYRKKIVQAVARQPRVSSIQRVLYGILDDLGLTYTPELIIGPWAFDCCIHRDGEKDILIECQGDYWHSLPRARNRDKAKATYIAKYFGEQYELKYLWEHEFLCQDKVVELIKYWSGLSKFELEQFVFGDVNISCCKASQYKPL